MAELDPAAPVVVTPIPAKQSRTLTLANILATLGSVLAVLPELATDPVVIAFINEVMSHGARRTFGVVMVAIGFYLRYLRNDTSAPIIGTDAAEKLPEAAGAKVTR